MNYTPAEVETWGLVYRKLGGYTSQFAIEQYNRILPLLEKVRFIFRLLKIDYGRCWKIWFAGVGAS